MTTNGRSKSTNTFVKRFINSHTSLADFANQVDITIDDIRQKEELDIMLEKCKRSNMKMMSPLQEQAYSVLTHFSFQMFQYEFERSIQYSIHHKNDNVLILEYYKDDNNLKHEVFWDGKIATCSCKLFKFWRILCRHVLSIFLHKYYHEIPSDYLSSRWRLQALHKDDDVVRDQIMDCNNEVDSQ
ncbi:unnamed protein product [Lathyrus oleraceus]